MDATTATDTVVNSASAYCFIVIFRTGTTRNICYLLYLKLLLPVCLRDFLAIEREDNIIVCCLRFMLKFLRENKSAAVPIHAHSNDSLCTQADFTAKKCSRLED